MSPYGLAKIDPGVRYFFDGLPGEKAGGYAFDELFRGYGDTNKEGMHDPPGMLLIKGPGIVAGAELGPSTNLDIAPTMLSLMGIPVPDQMSGRVLSEAWGERSQSLPAETRVVN